MIAFEVSLNGKLVCTAGIGDFGVLTSILTWVRRRPAYSRNGDTVEEELTFEVSGRDSREPTASENLTWLSETLDVGDNVSIRIVEVDTADPPLARTRDDPDTIERSRRQYFEQLTREYDG
jgi:hypothetical protein